MFVDVVGARGARLSIQYQRRFNHNDRHNAHTMTIKISTMKFPTSRIAVIEIIIVIVIGIEWAGRAAIVPMR